MARFYSDENIDRYRRLAADEIAPADRSRVLKRLAEEWTAFKREYREGGRPDGSWKSALSIGTESNMDK